MTDAEVEKIVNEEVKVVGKGLDKARDKAIIISIIPTLLIILILGIFFMDINQLYLKLISIGSLFLFPLIFYIFYKYFYNKFLKKHKEERG